MSNPEEWARRVLYTPSEAAREYLLEWEGVRVAAGIFADPQIGSRPGDPDAGGVRRAAVEIIAAVYRAQSDTRHRPVLAAVLREVAELLDSKTLERVPWGPRTTGFKKAREGVVLTLLEAAKEQLENKVPLPGLPVGPARSPTEGPGGGGKRRRP